MGKLGNPQICTDLHEPQAEAEGPRRRRGGRLFGAGGRPPRRV